MEYSAATEGCVDALLDVRKRALERGSTSEALWHITPECLKIAMRSEETGMRRWRRELNCTLLALEPLFCYVA